MQHFYIIPVVQHCLKKPGSSVCIVLEIQFHLLQLKFEVGDDMDI